MNKLVEHLGLGYQIGNYSDFPVWGVMPIIAIGLMFNGRIHQFYDETWGYRVLPR